MEIDWGLVTCDVTECLEFADSSRLAPITEKGFRNLVELIACYCISARRPASKKGSKV